MTTVGGRQKRRKGPVAKPKVQKGKWLMERPLPRQSKHNTRAHAQHFSVEIGKARKVNSRPTEGAAKRIPLGIEFISFCVCPVLNLLPSFLPFQPPLRRRGKEERGEGRPYQRFLDSKRTQRFLPVLLPAVPPWTAASHF